VIGLTGEPGGVMTNELPSHDELTLGPYPDHRNTQQQQLHRVDMQDFLLDNLDNWSPQGMSFDIPRGFLDALEQPDIILPQAAQPLEPVESGQSFPHEQHMSQSSHLHGDANDQILSELADGTPASALRLDEQESVRKERYDRSYSQTTLIASPGDPKPLWCVCSHTNVEPLTNG
jgi:hypothetical protein